MMENKIGLFFDAENISAKFVDEIFDELAKAGKVIIKKAYHNWSCSQSKSWSLKLQEFAIELIQVFSNITGKNSVDIKLTVDVTNLTHTNHVDIIVLASSDSDFTVLATDIKSKGIEVIGFGENKTPTCFRKAFSSFYELPKKKKDAITVLKDAIRNTQKENGYANVSDITRYLKNKDASYNAQNYGASKWSDIIKEHAGCFEMKYGNNKRALFVRVKNC